MSDKEKDIKTSGAGFSVTKTPYRAEHDQIKQRQKDRKLGGIPKNPTNEFLAQMCSDILENQARQENKLNAIMLKLGINI